MTDRVLIDFNLLLDIRDLHGETRLRSGNEYVTVRDLCEEIEFLRVRVATIREECAKVAEAPESYDSVGGSTGNAYGTQLRIAAAKR